MACTAILPVNYAAGSWYLIGQEKVRILTLKRPVLEIPDGLRYTAAWCFLCACLGVDGAAIVSGAPLETIFSPDFCVR